MNHYTGQYTSNEYNEIKQPRNRRNIWAPMLLIVAVALAAGLIGGLISWKLLDGREAQPTETTVNMQMVEASPNDTQAPLYAGGVVEQVAAGAGATVVEVSTESKSTHTFFGSYVTSGAGSGVILSSDGYIVTNDHVVEGAASVSVRLSDGYEYAARLVGTDSQTDLAVLKIEEKDLQAAVLADSDAVRVGQTAIAIGNPLGTLGGTVTEGIISAKDREIAIGGDMMTLLQTSAAINPGNSGGGLFNAEGHLIGIVNAKSSGSDIEGLGFAIPASTVRTVVTDLIEHGYVTGRPSIGAELIEVNSMEALYRNRVNEYGVYVSSVTGGSGLKKGDMMLAVDGESVKSISEVNQIIRRHSVGDTVELSVRRGTRQLAIEMELEEERK